MSWSLSGGTFLAVTGPSGSGKTSLLECLRGQIMPSAGSCKIGRNGNASVGAVFQNLRLSSELSVLTNVLCGRLGRYPWWRTLFGFGVEDRAKAFSVIEELGLSHLAHKPLHGISGGEQQRVAVARVLHQDPDIILADEPTSDLDSETAARVLDAFRRICDESGGLIIAVMHDAAMVERFADVELRIDPSYENGWSMREVVRG